MSIAPEASGVDRILTSESKVTGVDLQLQDLALQIACELVRHAPVRDADHRLTDGIGDDVVLDHRVERDASRFRSDGGRARGSGSST